MFALPAYLSDPRPLSNSLFIHEKKKDDDEMKNNNKYNNTQSNKLL